VFCLFADRLAVLGRQVSTWRPATFITDSAPDEVPHKEHEEILAIEGEQEELIAVDSSPRY
jgi:hypothetical protein